jgi:ribosome recycling factor
MERMFPHGVSRPSSRAAAADRCGSPEHARAVRSRAFRDFVTKVRPSIREVPLAQAAHDLAELKRRMHGAVQVLKQELGGLRTGRASASLLDPIQVEAYGTHMPLNTLATVSVPEARMISVQVWDRSMVSAVERAIIGANLGLNPATEGQVMRLRIPELNEERRKDLVKVAHKYAEAARVAVRHVRRDGLDILKKLEKDHKISKDDHERDADQIQKATDQAIADIDQMLGGKEREILTV